MIHRILALFTSPISPEVAAELAHERVGAELDRVVTMTAWQRARRAGR